MCNISAIMRREQTTQHSPHYQLARTHICSHFSHGQLPTGTNNQLSRETISQLFPPVSALFADSSADIPSHDTPAVMVAAHNHRSTEEYTV